MKKHTRATPAGVPRSRSKYTRRERRRMLAGYIARRRVSFEFAVGNAADWPSVVWDGTPPNIPDEYHPKHQPTITLTWVHNPTPPA